ncbi:MAG TPA: hypothetical protein VFQ53_04400 [Kofleriaceae bacterium]|nr:hypothetical protein [Kofleriaceae bacterium]
MMTVVDALWPLLRAVAATGEAAWPALAAALPPVLLPMTARQPIGRLRDHDDTPHEILTRVLERLRAREFAAIAKLCAADPPPPLQAWLRVLVRRSAIDYLRESPEYQRRTAAWVSLATLTSAAPGAIDSLADKRNALLAFVRAAVDRAEAEYRTAGDDAFGALAATWSIPRIHVRRLVQRGAHYLAVIDAVLAGHSYPEIAAQLQLSRREVELTVQYLEEFLAARRFGTSP